MRHSSQKISLKSGYVLVERAPDYEVILYKQPEMLQELSAFCEDAGCRKVLIVGQKTKVYLAAFDIYDLGKDIAETDLQLAMVESHDASAEQVEFLENVAVNRGGSIQFFDTEEEAKSWLGVT